MGGSTGLHDGDDSNLNILLNLVRREINLGRSLARNLGGRRVLMLHV